MFCHTNSYRDGFSHDCGGEKIWKDRPLTKRRQVYFLLGKKCWRGKCQHDFHNIQFWHFILELYTGKWRILGLSSWIGGRDRVEPATCRILVILLWCSYFLRPQLQKKSVIYDTFYFQSGAFCCLDDSHTNVKMVEAIYHIICICFKNFADTLFSYCL